MFIPIHAKADIVGEKKGKITPAQASQLNAWCLASKTGILDWGGKCEATATSYSISNNVATIVLNKGYIVICGRLVEVEQNTSIDIDTSANPSGKIILSFNLSSSGKEEFKVEVVDRVLRQDDLNENPISGVYEFELYSYSVTSTTVTLNRNVQYIKSVSERLDELGFKEGVAEFRVSNSSIENTFPFDETKITVNSLKKQGKYCIFNFKCIKPSTLINRDIYIPEPFRPDKEVYFFVKVSTNATGIQSPTIRTGSVMASGLFYFDKDYVWDYGNTTEFEVLNAGWTIKGDL